MTTRRLAVVAEHQNFYSAGLAAMLQREVGFTKVIRVYDHGALVDLLASDSSPDFLALDFDLPGADGNATVTELRAMRPSMRIAVFSDRTDLQDILSVLATGAHGFIPKQITDCAELLRALKIVADFGVFVPGNLIDAQRPRKVEGDGEETTLCTFAKLTERQQQVIKLLSDGHANKVIARELGISPSTVKVHVHAAFRTLGIHSRFAAQAALRSPRGTSAHALGGGVRLAISS